MTNDSMTNDLKYYRIIIYDSSAHIHTPQRKAGNQCKN